MRHLNSVRGLIIVGCTLAAGTALADGKWRGKAYNDYFACAITPPVKVEGTIVDAALATPALSTLVDLVVAAGLVDT